jgi:hypothetical protein
MAAATKADFLRADVGAALSGVEQTCWRFSGVLYAKAEQAAKAGDGDLAWVLSLLSDVASYGLKADDWRQPYGPRMAFEGKRTASIEDLQDDQLAFLAEIYADIPVAELRARVADVLFVRKRHHAFARVAVDAYLASATQLLSQDRWVPALHLLERALAISIKLKDETRVIARITQEIETRCPDASFFSAKLMQVLYDQRVGEPEKIAKLAERAAQKADADKDYHREHEYLSLAARSRRRANQPDDERRLILASAESYVKLADAADTRSLEGAFLEQAIKHLRTTSGTQARVEELHRRLLVAEKQSLAEMKGHERPLELNDSIERARAHVAGQPLPAAIFRLALMWRPRPVGEIQNAVLETARQAVFYSSIPRVMMNRQGKVVAKRGSILSGTEEEKEKTLRQMMFERASQQRHVVAVSTLDPARSQVIEEHYVGYRDLMPITMRSPFVPPGREEVFAVGLADGFNGNYASSLHLLIPQFENSVRMILAQAGAATSKIDEDGVQDEKSLNELLFKNEHTLAAFGEDLLFDMQGLLVDRWGGNLRNQFAHGLLEVDEMTGPGAIYFWWLTLHLAIRPLLPISEPAVEKESPASPASPETGSA